jgi:hypothetical protein
VYLIVRIKQGIRRSFICNRNNLSVLQKWKLLVTTTVHYDEATHDPMDNNQILVWLLIFKYYTRERIEEYLRMQKCMALAHGYTDFFEGKK